MAAVCTVDASFVRYPGDDWTFSYTYQDDAGAPINLTGATPSAKLFVSGFAAPTLLLTGMPYVTVLDARAGRVVFKVPRAVTVTVPPDVDQSGNPTRIQVQLLDTADNLETYAVDPVPVANPRSMSLC